jgi:mRNA interferase MazF
MTYDPFSIVVVPFPFTEKLQTKRRPALVLSSTDHQAETKHITLLMITSAKHSSWESDHTIELLESTGLTSPSIIRQKLFTIDMRLVINRLGNLSDHDVKKIKKILTSHLAIKQ